MALRRPATPPRAPRLPATPPRRDDLPSPRRRSRTPVRSSGPVVDMRGGRVLLSGSTLIQEQVHLKGATPISSRMRPSSRSPSPVRSLGRPAISPRNRTAGGAGSGSGSTSSHAGQSRPVPINAEQRSQQEKLLLKMHMTKLTELKRHLRRRQQQQEDQSGASRPGGAAAGGSSSSSSSSSYSHKAALQQKSGTVQWVAETLRSMQAIASKRGGSPRGRPQSPRRGGSSQSGSSHYHGQPWGGESVAPQCCVALGAGLVRAVKHVPAFVSIQLRDESGQTVVPPSSMVPADPLSAVVVVTGSSGPFSSSRERGHASTGPASNVSTGSATASGSAVTAQFRGRSAASHMLQDNGDGTYFLAYCINVTGEYHVDIRAGGYHISGSPFLIAVTDGHTDPAKSTIEPPRMGPAPLNAGEEFSFTVKAADKFGQAKADGGDYLTVEMFSTEDDAFMGLPPAAYQPGERQPHAYYRQDTPEQDEHAAYMRQPFTYEVDDLQTGSYEVRCKAHRAGRFQLSFFFDRPPSQSEQASAGKKASSAAAAAGRPPPRVPITGDSMVVVVWPGPVYMPRVHPAEWLAGMTEAGGIFVAEELALEFFLYDQSGNLTYCRQHEQQHQHPQTSVVGMIGGGAVGVSTDGMRSGGAGQVFVFSCVLTPAEAEDAASSSGMNRGHGSGSPPFFSRNGSPKRAAARKFWSRKYSDGMPSEFDIHVPVGGGWCGVGNGVQFMLDDIGDPTHPVRPWSKLRLAMNTEAAGALAFYVAVVEEDGYVGGLQGMNATEACDVQVLTGHAAGGNTCVTRAWFRQEPKITVVPGLDSRGGEFTVISAPDGTSTIEEQRAAMHSGKLGGPLPCRFNMMMRDRHGNRIDRAGEGVRVEVLTYRPAGMAVPVVPEREVEAEVMTTFGGAFGGGLQSAVTVFGEHGGASGGGVSKAGRAHQRRLAFATSQSLQPSSQILLLDTALPEEANPPHNYIRDNGDGTVEVSLRLPEPIVRLIVTVGEDRAEHVQGSPFHTSLSAATGADALTCVSGLVFPEGEQGKALPKLWPDGVCGDEQTVHIVARDEDGHDLDVGGDLFVVMIEGGTAGVANPYQRLVADDHGDGTYSARFTVEQAGEYMIHVLLAEEPLLLQPPPDYAATTAAATTPDWGSLDWFDSLVALPISSSPSPLVGFRSGPVYSPSCSVHGLGTVGCSPRTGGNFTIKATDRFGNLVVDATNEFRVTIAGPSRIMANVACMAELGFYWAQYNPQVTGAYTLSVMHAGKHVKGSEFDVVVDDDFDSRWADLQKSVVDRERHLNSRGHEWGDVQEWTSPPSSPLAMSASQLYHQHEVQIGTAASAASTIAAVAADVDGSMHSTLRMHNVGGTKAKRSGSSGGTRSKPRRLASNTESSQKRPQPLRRQRSVQHVSGGATSPSTLDGRPSPPGGFRASFDGWEGRSRVPDQFR